MCFVLSPRLFAGLAFRESAGIAFARFTESLPFRPGFAAQGFSFLGPILPLRFVSPCYKRVVSGQFGCAPNRLHLQHGVAHHSLGI